MKRLDISQSSSLASLASLLLAAFPAGCTDDPGPEGMTEVHGVIKLLPDVSNAYQDSATGHSIYCDYNGASITLPGDPFPDLVCVQCYDPYGTPAVDWWYSASDGSLNSWGWYSSGGAVNWGACRNPQGGTPDYHLSVGMRLTNGSAGPWFVSSIPCKRP